MLLYLKLYCAFSYLVYIIECQDSYSYRDDRWKTDRFYASNEDINTEVIATRVRGIKDRRSDLLIWRRDASTILSTVKDTGVFQRYSMEVTPPIFCPFQNRVDGGVRMRLYSGDINGDQRDDLICHDETSGEVTVRLLSYTYHPATTLEDTDGEFVCPGADSIRIGDFDGNGSDDILCLDTFREASGSVEVDDAAEIYLTKGCYSRYHHRGKREIYLEAAFVQEGHPRNCPSHLPAVVSAVDGTATDKSLCDLPSNANSDNDEVIVHVGDVNGDGRADVICQDRRAWEIYYRLGQGLQGTTDKFVFGDIQRVARPPPDNWNGIYGLPFCYFDNKDVDPRNSGGTVNTDWIMKVGDVNGDGKSDLLCLQKVTNMGTSLGIQILFAPLTENVDKVVTVSGFCAAGVSHGDYFQIGDFNGDGKDDVLCRRGDTGNLAITEIVASEKEFSTVVTLVP